MKKRSGLFTLEKKKAAALIDFISENRLGCFASLVWESQGERNKMKILNSFKIRVRYNVSSASTAVRAIGSLLLKGFISCLLGM